jgi:hypothetical protein
VPFLCLFLAWAARPAAAAWALGPLGGANLSRDDVSGHAEANSVTGWDIGARLQMGMAPILSLMLDPMLVQSRTEFQSSNPALQGRGDFVSLDVPVLLNARLDFMNLGFYGFLGPDLVFTTDGDGNIQAQDDISRDDLSPLVLAGQVGAGLAMGVAPFIDVTADARYTHGFNDLIDGARGDIEHWRTRDVRLNLGVLLHTPHMGSLFRPGNAFQNPM